MKKTAIKVAWITTVTPLVVGILIFLLWLWLRHYLLSFAGFCTIVGGIGSISAGLVFLIRHIISSIHTNGIKFPLIRTTVIILLVIAANFVVAFYCCYGALRLGLESFITITNMGNDTLNHVVLNVSGDLYQLPDIPAGKTIHYKFVVQGDGQLVISSKCNGTLIEDKISEYITCEPGKAWTIQIDNAGKVSKIYSHPVLY